MQINHLLHQSNISTTLYNKEEIYPGFTKITVFKQPLQIRESGWEETEDSINLGSSEVLTDLEMLELERLNTERSIRRTRKSITDYILCNDFDMFCTFTFDSSKFGNIGTDDLLCDTKMSNWLDNQRKRYGRFDYIIVKEYGSKNGRIHYHAIFNGFKGNFKSSGKIINGSEIFNLTGWRQGFSTMSFIKDKDKLSSYVRKYITKELAQVKGIKRYWCSKGLKKPVSRQNISISDYDHDLMTLQFENDFVKVYLINT